MPFFKPDRYFARLTDVDVDADILRPGFTHLLLDVDNTILPRDTEVVPPDILAWIARVRDPGVVICLNSNNWHEPVLACARNLGLPLVRGSVKPLPFAFFAARRRIGAPRRRTLVIGDQLVTDGWGGHVCGMRVYLLAPLCETDLWHTRLLRHIESGILNGIQPERKESDAEDAVAGS